MSFTGTAFVSQLSILATLLLGFAITAVIQLAVWKEMPRAGTLAFRAFIGSAVALLLVVWIGSLLSIGLSASVTAADFSPGGRYTWTIGGMTVGFVLGLAGFLVGLASLGFAHSKAIGSWALLIVALGTVYMVAAAVALFG